MEKSSNRKIKKSGLSKSPKKLKYKTPRLMNHGSFTKLTMGGGGTENDPGGGGGGPKTKSGTA